LRELEIGDKKELTKVLGDPESMQYYPHPFSEENVENWIHWNSENYKKYKHGLWAVILKEGEIFIGESSQIISFLFYGAKRSTRSSFKWFRYVFTHIKYLSISPSFYPYF
jgi:RimJ/RimL family protein N-acetyltransferase